MSEHGDIIDSTITLSGSGVTVGDDPNGGVTGVGALADLTEGHGGYGTANVAIGQRIGPFELERHLGSGGMGEVYAARHQTTGKQVAIKFLSRTTPRLLYRFKREFRALADVSHRNVITLGELVVPPTSAAFFTMELIDGLPFTDYVRRRARVGELPNLVRLGRALRQLAKGLARLHDAGCVHRDVKPSNVLVTHEGRVVILDFGLVSELTDDDQGISQDGQPIGTPAYMAPEQAAMQAITPAADFYALGVLLFECLTGVLPYRGSAIEIVMLKQDAEIPDPSEFVQGIPSELRGLCMRLLARDPSQRPTREQLLAALATRALGAGEGSKPHAVARRRDHVPFVGRERELAALGQAMRDVQNNRSAVTVHISGASGFGKSALIGRFLTQTRATSNTMILRGRCLERESVPYKGVDSVVDSLSLRLHRMSDDDLDQLQPRNVAPLIQIFPVLSDIWQPEHDSAQRYEPNELRHLGIAALREVLTGLARTRPLLIHIDDFQWADVDGARLLSSLVRPPEPPALLLLVSFRGSTGVSSGAGGRLPLALCETSDAQEPAEAQCEALRELTSAEARLGRDLRELSVGPLADSEARELAWGLMGAEQTGTIVEQEQLRRRADAFARGARGNPFYIGQMVLEDATEAGENGDDRVVARRIVQLDPESRRLLATVAVSGGPMPIAVVRDLYEHGTRSGIGELGSWSEQLTAVGAVIDKLCALGLLTRRGGEFDSSHDRHESHDSLASGNLSGPVLETAHGRIREVTVGELETSELAQIHLELGLALERLGGEPETLAEHFERAGELVRATNYAEKAAEQAVAALAFGRAVQQYRRALALLELLAARGQDSAAERVRRRRLRGALATQLVNFGHSSEAGRLLRELADEAVTPKQALVLRRNAAEQLLHAGHVGEGLALAATVLREIGESPPRGFWASMWSFMWGRLRMSLRGYKHQVRAQAEVPKATLDHIDTLMTINKGLILHLEMHSWVLHNRLLRLTLDAGEPGRLAVMLANEMTIVASFGGEAKVHGLASRARELAALVGDPEIDRTIDFQRDLVDYALNRFGDAADQLRQLLPRLEEVAGANWLRFTAVLVYSSLCVITGRFADLYRNLPQWLAAARDRGNLREIVELEAYAAMTELHRGDLGQARYHLDTGREAWDDTHYNYTTVMLDRVEIFILLGERDHEQLLERIDKLQAAVRRSSVALNPVVKRFVDQLIGRCWAAAAVQAPANTKLQAQVRKVCRRLRRTKVALYVGEAAINEAALHSIAGDDTQTRRCWREAELLFDQSGIECNLASVRWQLAKVTEGDEAKGFARAADKYFEANGINDPARVAQMLVPSRDAT